MAATASIAIGIAGTAMKAGSQSAAGGAAVETALNNASTTAEVGTLNSQLQEETAQLNAGVHDFNALALEGQATDAVQVGAQQETLFRQQLKQKIGTERAEYAGQGVEVSTGSALDVQKDTAYQGELDALQIRTNAARQAWGYTVASEGEQLQAQSTLTLGQLESQNTLEVALLNAANLRQGGNIQAQAQNNNVISTLLTGAGGILGMAQQYGWGGGNQNPAGSAPGPAGDFA